jgi:hypothetical protein
LNVYFFLILGVFLLTVPWSVIWSQAILVIRPESLAGVADSGWVRGAVSGVGALDLFIAAREGRTLWRTMNHA